jgi:PAS domain S-box-containing protein
MQLSMEQTQSREFLAQQVQDWQTLHSMSLSLLKVRTLDDQLDVILKTVADFHQGSQGLISLYDPARSGLVPRAHIGLGQAWMEQSACIPIGTGSCGTAFQTQSRVIIEDVESDSRFAPYVDLAMQEGIHALYSTPFYESSGKPLGVLTIHLRTPRRPTEREMQLTDICVGQIALLVERDRSEQKLHAEMRRSQHILETMNEGFVLMDRDFRILQINAEGLRIDGRREEEMIGRSHWEVWPDSENTIVGQAYKRAMAERRPVRFENCYTFAGVERWFTVHAYPHGDGLAVIYRDITELRLTNAQLKEAQDRLEATLNAGEVATWIWNIQEDRVWADKNLAKLFGVSAETAKGASVSHYLNSVHPDDVQSVTQAIEQALANGDHFQAKYRVRNESGQYHWILAQGRIERDTKGNPVRMPGVVLDITRQKEMEDILRVTEERYRAVINSMDDGFCVIQVIFDETNTPYDYRFIETNPAFERQTGLSGIVGKRVKEILPDLEQKWFDLYGNVALTGRSFNLIEESDLMGRWFDLFAARLGDPKDKHVAVLFTDITERKKSEVQLKQLASDLSEANRRKTEFIATLAHELRNPLAPIRTGLDFMQLAGDMPASHVKVHAMMERQLNQMVHLIDDLMDVGRISSGKIELKRERINLKQVIANAVEAVFPLIEAAHHQLDAQVPDEPIFIYADSTRITQVLANLLTNAGKYTPDGGKISLRAAKQGGQVIISVIDNGIGIPKEAQHGLFELFSQVPGNLSHAQGGLGIGLSLVKSLVQLHGGTVKVMSEGQGKGSTFVVELPLIEQNAEGSSAPMSSDDTEAALQENGVRILVADDNIDAAHMMKVLLEASGHDVEMVHNGEAALRQAKTKHFDLIILDIGMPGMNGYEVASEIRKLPDRENMVLAALTGWGTQEDRERVKAAGFDAHLTKPASLIEIKQLIATRVSGN